MRTLIKISLLLLCLGTIQKAEAFTIGCDSRGLCLDAMSRPVYVNCQKVICDRSVGILLPDGSRSGLCTVSTTPEFRLADCCTMDSECNDSNECTKDYCNRTTNTCVHSPDTRMPTTAPDVCKQWLCQPTTGRWDQVPVTDHRMCTEDGNLCTEDRCDATGACLHTPLAPPSSAPAPVICKRWSCVPATGAWDQVPDDTLTCDDGNACTNTACRSGVCSDITTPAESAMLCPRPVCTTLDAATTCNDRNACTADTCVSGSCRNTAISIDDANPCTTDMCQPATGISHTPITYNDDNLCTVDSCHAVTGAPVFTPRSVEDDGNICTKDICDPLFGMLHNLDISRGYECYEGADCDLTTCRRRTTPRPTCTVDCRQPFMSIIGIRVVPQAEPGIRCAFALETHGVSGVTCRGESLDFSSATELPVDTAATGLKTIRALCKTPDMYSFSCEDSLSIVPRVGGAGASGSGGMSGTGGAGASGSGGMSGTGGQATGGSGGVAGGGNSTGGQSGTGGNAPRGTGGNSNVGSGGRTGGGDPIPTETGLSSYDVYFCVTNDMTAVNLRGQVINLTTPCPQLPLSQAVEDDQRQTAEMLVGVDPTSDNFYQNVRPMIALAVQRWMGSENDRTVYKVQMAPSVSLSEVTVVEKPVIRANYNRYFRITAQGIERQVAADTHPLFSESASSQSQALLLNFDRVYAEGGGCSLLPLLH